MKTVRLNQIIHILFLLTILSESISASQLRDTLDNTTTTHQGSRKAQEAYNSLEQGTATAETFYWLGVSNLYGKNGIPQNSTKGIQFISDAVYLGSSKAELHLAELYFDGVLTEKNCGYAIQTLTNLASNGNAKAQVKLASAYGLGLCVKQNRSLSRDYLEKALKSDSASAHSLAGVEYFFGNLYPKNLKKAFKHFERATALGSCDAAGNLSAMYDNGLYVPIDIEKSFLILQRAVDLGCPTLFDELGNYYIRGRHVEQNNEKAFELYQMATDRGDLSGQVQLAYMYINGQAPYRSTSKGLDLLIDAAGKGHDEAATELGILYQTGVIPRDYEQAIYWLKEGIKYNDPRALYNLGLHYEYGYGTSINLSKAHHYYNLSLAQNFEMAILQQAYWNVVGKHHPKDLLKAKSIYEKYMNHENGFLELSYALFLMCTPSPFKDVQYAATLIKSRKANKSQFFPYIDFVESALDAEKGNFSKAIQTLQRLLEFDLLPHEKREIQHYINLYRNQYKCSLFKE
ncbi:tetratricopeptide repeat protein [Microbulbifer sp. TRSA001]|uniref:tetratricopeptide repeat protein n=1 Tax=Microbulbifer sp. TRSA001 TaxID=3243381 RepID=UPI004038FC54